MPAEGQDNHVPGNMAQQQVDMPCYEGQNNIANVVEALLA